MFRQAMARWAGSLLLVTALSCAAAHPAAAQDSLGENTSLGQVPDDVSFYSALFNGRQVYDAIMGSNAVQRVLELPVTQASFDELYGELDQEGLLDWMEEPENQQLLELLADMGSHEIYICGDEGVADISDIYTECVVETVKVSWQLRREGYWDANEAMIVKATLDVLERRLEEDNLELPNLVIGCKITQEDAAEEQLARLEQLLLMLIEEMDPDLPDLEGRLERVTVGENEMLTLRLDGSLFPWEELDWVLGEIEMSIDDYEETIEELKEMELLVSLGVRDGYAILAVGPDLDFVANLGEGPSLWENEHFEPLREADLAVNEVFGVSYISDSMAERLDGLGRMVNTYIDLFETMAGVAGGGSASEFLEDVPELRRDIASVLPQRRAMMGYSFFTERGLEGYVFDRSLNQPYDSSQTLPILDHGGDPLLMVAGRQPYSTRNYELAAKWAARIYGYWETELRAWGDPDSNEMLDNMRENCEPLVEELHNIMLTMVLPSMSDGQWAVVLDGDVTSETWYRHMDPPEEPLPMVEVGVVMGLSDADMLIEACTSGREVINDLLEEMRDASRGEMPEDFYLPSPEVTEVEGGEMFSYPWEEMEFHEEINPNAIVSDEWLVLSLSPEHSQRMLEERPLPETPPLARRDEPLAGVVYIDVAGSIDAIEPWVEYFVAGNDTWGQYRYEYEDEVWAEEWVEEGDWDEDWDGAEGEDPFEEDPFGEENPFGEEAPFDEGIDPDDFEFEEEFAEEIEEYEAPADDGDPFGGEDPFEDREPHRFADPYGDEIYGPYGYEEHGYYEPRHRHQWEPGEAEETAEAYLNLIRSVDTFSAALYHNEDDVLVTHFEWHIVDAGAPASDSDAEPAEESEEVPAEE